MSDGDSKDTQGRTTAADAAGSRTDAHNEAQQQVRDLIGRKEARRLRAKNEQHRRVWFGLGMFGLVGWSVTIPTLLGTAIGMWIDARWDGQQSWTLMLLIGGLILGCLQAWRWLRDESEVR
ncbi:MAG: ATPase F0F1 [Fuerstiella sp.]|nr:ATPase F0F1 [Fuerstiella sp.]MCP4855865.1 ATPase F0F1 [Fuerstiella sp.]